MLWKWQSYWLWRSSRNTRIVKSVPSLKKTFPVPFLKRKGNWKNLCYCFSSTSIPPIAKGTKSFGSISHTDPSVVTIAQSVLVKVHKVLLHGPTDLSLDELLAKVDIERDTTKPLETSKGRSLVILKCEPNECCVNNYNAPVMLAWQANIDLVTVCAECTCLCHVCSFLHHEDW